jgi:hypothetical protein
MYSVAAEHPSSEGEEFEYIETPEIDSWDDTSDKIDYVKQGNISIVIQSPENGAKFTDDTVVVRFEVINASKAQGFSAMAYFGGGGNPVAVDLVYTDISLIINELQFGPHSVRILLLNSRREPTGIEASVTFERILTGDAPPPQPDFSRFDARSLAMALPVALWDSSSSPAAAEESLLASYRELAAAAVAAAAAAAGAGAAVADPAAGAADTDASADAGAGRPADLPPGAAGFAAAARLLFARSERDVAEALRIAGECAEEGNDNCRFLLIALGDMDMR